MRALVTGASGFIGSHVVAALIESGADVRAFDLRAPASDVEFVAGDVLDREAVGRALDRCDAIFHLAALYSYARADIPVMEAVNVTGTRTVLDAAVRAGVRRFVHTSSCATCGPVAGRRATEADRPSASELRVPYRRTKLDGERLALDAARKGLEVVVVNPTVPVGPGDARPTPTGKMVSDVAHGRARGYLARSALNVVAVGDVARGHVLAYERGRPGERYLLGGEDISIREVFAEIARTAGLTPPRVIIPWSLAYTAALAAGAALGPFGREPDLLLLDEVKSGRLPHRFDDSKARLELGYTSRPGRQALAEATRAILQPA
jgi:dihydroflavonol-4-reductase